MRSAAHEDDAYPTITIAAVDRSSGVYEHWIIVGAVANRGYHHDDGGKAIYRHRVDQVAIQAADEGGLGLREGYKWAFAAVPASLGVRIRV